MSTEPDILDNFCATSQQASNLFLSPSEEKATIAEVKSRVTEESEIPANYNSAMKEHLTQDGPKDTVDTDQDDEEEEGKEEEEEPCRDCGCLACLDGEVISPHLAAGSKAFCCSRIFHETCNVLFLQLLALTLIDFLFCVTERFLKPWP